MTFSIKLLKNFKSYIRYLITNQLTHQRKLLTLFGDTKENLLELRHVSGPNFLIRTRFLYTYVTPSVTIICRNAALLLNIEKLLRHHQPLYY